MYRQTILLIALISIGVLFCFGLGQARTLYTPIPKLTEYDPDDPPCTGIAVHNIGRMNLTISNFGMIGLPREYSADDPMTGEPAPSWTYPPGYEMNYLEEGQIWVGAVIGRDTCVSTSRGLWYQEDVHEWWPLPCPDGAIKYRSSKDKCSPEFDSSVSQQDFIATYTDTITDENLTGYDQFMGRLHHPLKVQIKQKSYAWSYSYAEDFVIMDLEITNMELKDLEDVYIGLYMDPDCGKTNSYSYGWDDICGYQRALPSQYIWGLMDTLDIVWASDNDGDPDPITGAYFGYRSPTSAIATKILRSPGNRMFNFNWWVSDWTESYDWGPRKSNDGQPVRKFYGRLGTPVGDNSKYYMMAHKEFDYNQLDMYRDNYVNGWLPVPPDVMRYAGGADIKYLMSFGPYTMKAGEIYPLTIAFVSGEHFQPGNNFMDLQNNVLWAKWIYDNPGVDTDGDGYKGKYHIYCLNEYISRIDTIAYGPSDTLFDTVTSCRWSDTLWYEGDGVPDFVGAKPPVNPKLRIFPELDENNRGRMIIRWNGLLTETTPDQFSQENDFEGYRVYISNSGRQCDYTMMASFDIDNYDRYELFSGYNNRGIIITEWRIKQPPFTLDDLKKMYGPNFDPNDYYDTETLFNYYDNSTGNTEHYYFARHDWNTSDLTDTLAIHKIYPDQKYPSTLNLDTANMFYPQEVTEEGRLKYFEYEYILRDLLPSIPYYVSVTTFDHGVPQNGLAPIETDPADTGITVLEYAQPSSKTVEEKGLDVVVYPNPYRIDVDYRQYYEGWEEPNRPIERTRAIHFANLPHKCTIKIFSIDGDLIKTIDHDFAIGAASSSHDTWDLISRNYMPVVSGIYYYSVESDYGNQVGKFVIIM